MITLAAQFGISPTMPASSSPISGLFRINEAKCSSPTRATAMLIRKVVSRRKEAIFTVWKSAERSTPFSALQPSCSQMSCRSLPEAFPKRRSKASIRKPASIPAKNLYPRIFMISPGGTLRESRIGSISSEVERNTAISVPLVISPSVNRLAVAAENPHCGITPSALPMAGPHFPARWISAMVLSSARCSSSSISR